MKKRTHKIVEDVSNLLLFVGTEKQCNQFLVENTPKPINMIQGFVLIMMPLSTESFKYKLVDLEGKLICQNTEINCYLAMDKLITDNDNFKVVELTEKESEFYRNQNPPQIKK